MKFKNLFLLLLVALNCTVVSAQSDPKLKGLEALTESMMRSQLNFLSSDYMEGRATIEKGGKIAAEYIATQFEIAGIKPAGDIINGKRSYLQRVPFIRAISVEQGPLTIKTTNGSTVSENSFESMVDYVGSTPVVSGNITSEVVFVGYGMIDENDKYNDFKGVDIKDKIVVVLEGFPSHQNPNTSVYQKYAPDPKVRIDPRKAAGLKYIKESNAVAIINLLSMEDYKMVLFNFAKNRTFYPSERVSPSRPRLMLLSDYFTKNPGNYSVSPRVANLLFNNSGIDIASYEKEMENGAKPTAKLLKNKSINVKDVIKTDVVVGYNVVGLLEGKDPSKNLVVGGHYDHMGMTETHVWNGADDNASGTVAVMSIAKAFMTTGVQPEKSVIFAAWTGEELGLLGSSYFVKSYSTYFPNTSMVMNMNFDMLSRNDKNDKEGNTLDLEYSIDNKEYMKINSDNIKNYNINIVVTESPVKPGNGGGTDYLPFYRAGVPFMGWFAGFTPDYHQPSDDVSKVNYPKFYNAIRLGFLDTWDIANLK